MSDAPAPSSCHTQRHRFLGAGHDANARRTLWVVWLTLTMMVVEIVAGLLTRSMALLADGIHMGTHAGALGVAALAYRYARNHADDPRFSFGTGKVGDLAGFGSALALGIFAVGIGWESIQRLFAPAAIAFGEAIAIGVLGLAVNLASAWLLAGGHGHGDDGHGHGGHGHSHAQERAHSHAHGHDNNLRAAYFHVLADALTSVLAIGALVLGLLAGWGWADAAVGIVGAIVIARWSLSLMRESATVLLDTADPALEAAVRSRVEAAGDAVVTDLHIWRIGPAARAAIVSVTGAAPIEELRRRVGAAGDLAHVTIARE